MIQLILIGITLWWFNRRYRAVISQFKSRIKRFNDVQDQQKQVIAMLSNQVQELAIKVESKDPDIQSFSSL